MKKSKTFLLNLIDMLVKMANYIIEMWKIKHNNPLAFIRNSRITKVVALYLCFHFPAEYFLVQPAFALTSGPSQPEASSFQQMDVSNLVDPFTGDFSYNIPLMEIGGYPINLSYAGGITMDQEASWVGLGWNVNTGAITRSVRGIPDDFFGDEVTRDYNVKPNETYGAKVDLAGEIVGFPLGVSLGANVSYNNYTGYNIGTSINPSLSIGGGGSFGGNVGLGLSASSQGGLDISPSVSFSYKNQRSATSSLSGSLGFGLNINSRSGLGNLTLNASATERAKADVSHRNWATMGSIGRGTSISFATPSFTPQIQLPFKTLGLDFRGKIGIGIVTGDVDISVGGYFSGQELVSKQAKSPAFGYLYSEKGQKNDKALHDFTREKDAAFQPGVTTNLPITSFTYDIYNIQAQGLGGSIRPFRNDASFIYDKTIISPSASGNFGFEVSPTQTVDAGFDFNLTTVHSWSGKWNDANMASGLMEFKDRKAGDITENFHFRIAGEMTVDSDDDFYNKIRKEDAVKIKVEKQGLTIATANKLTDENYNQYPINNNLRRKNRQNRSSSVEYLTVGEMKYMYPHRAKYLPTYAKDHHIGQITVINGDGTRYVFALPAYNTSQQEITFAVGTGFENPSPSTVSSDSAFVAYGVSENSTSNQRGIDHNYDRTTTPPYIHTWYLTEVLSADYVDVGGDGPSEDDLGTYTAFYYGRANSTADIPHYLWRTPVSANSPFWASYNENLKSDKSDDVANIIFGRKQIWYLDKIESKTQVCVFSLSDREDGYGVTGVDGFAGGAPQRKIDKISLYSKEDYDSFGAFAVPIKEVHFEYSYDLCVGIPNNKGLNPSDNNGGKLTLKSVYFTYEKSGRAKFSPYLFDYHEGNASENPNYNITQYDRWGNYKQRSAELRNADYPYTGQIQSNQDEWVAVWNLKEILLPSGGKINMEYESDDYAYVQDKQASRMFKVRGAAKNKQDTPSPNLFTNNDTHLYLFFDLESPLSTSDYTETEANDYVRNHYLLGMPFLKDGPSQFLYFRFFINVAHGNTPKYEFVSGYAEIESIDSVGVRSFNTGQWDVGCIKLKGVDFDDNTPGNANPVSKAAWQFSRIQLPRYAFNQPDPTDDSFEAIMTKLASANVFAQLQDLFQGVNRRMKDEGFGASFSPKQSWIRLLDPDGIKLGGGHRVKSVNIDDNWSAMAAGETSFGYGQEFSYRLTDGKSSGVASWEPSFGADENSHRIPIFMDKKALLAPDERFYLERPLGESLFPGPSVGYSRVEIKNKQHAGVVINATGRIVHEFYTAKDFPTKVRQTTIGTPARLKSNPLFSLLTMTVYDMIGVSQGYSIILNDMHGKKKNETVYDEKGSQISRQEYYYSTAGNELHNQVEVVLPNGKKEMREMGVDYDFIADFREMSTLTVGGGIQANLAAFLASIIPIFIPSIFPSMNAEFTQFRSATVTKVINKTGILTKTVAYDLGAKVETENMAFDSRTGQVLVTKVNNEFNDDRYAVNYPAHFAYDRMGFAGINWGYRFLGAYVTGSHINYDRTTGKLNGDAEKILVPGDELYSLIEARRGDEYVGAPVLTANSSRLWVSQDSLGDKYLIDHLGVPYLSSVPNIVPLVFKVVRSGRRNMPTMGIGSVESMDTPFYNDSLHIRNTDHILNTSSQEYWEMWKNQHSLPFSQLYTAEDCQASADVEDLMDFFNQLINDNRFNTGGVTVNRVDVTQDYPVYDTLLFHNYADPGCEHFYSGGNYEYGWLANPDFAGHASYKFMLEEICAALPVELCEDSKLICLTDSVMFPGNAFQDIASFSLQFFPWDLNGYERYIYDSYTGNAGPCVVVKGIMNNGEEHYFLVALANTCLGINLACTEISEIYPCNFETGHIVNPFLYGMLGNWRALKSYTYLTDRIPNQTNNQVDRREDGYFNIAEFFWKKPQPNTTGDWYKTTQLAANQWRWVTQITNYSPYGFEIENKDALNNHSSAIYGYKNTLPIMVAQNAKYKEIGFDGFEDYYPNFGWGVCGKQHFKFEENRNWVSSEEAHTGWNSLKIQSGDTAIMTRIVTPPIGQRTYYDVPFSLLYDDLLGYWSPDSLPVHKKYVLSFWIKDPARDPYTHDYTNFATDVRILGVSVMIPGSLKKSPIIEGWQRYEVEFVIPSHSIGGIKLYFSNINNAVSTFFLDDVRAHPFDATAKSFVYDARSLKFMAELDENNYATFYEYDEDGALVRVKKETERGIMTIQENKNKTFKRSIP